jgi:hypothetical protein
MATDVSKDLKKMSKVWSKTEAKKGGGGSSLPDEDYKGKITAMTVGKSKKGRLQVATTFEIKKPKDYRGKTKMTFHGLDTENNIAYFKGFAEVLGLELPDDMEDLPEAIESFLEDFDEEISFSLKTKGDFQNVKITAVGDTEIENEEDSEEDSEEEDSEDGEEEAEEEAEEEEAEEEEEGEEEEEDKKKKKKKKKKSKK